MTMERGKVNKVENTLLITAVVMAVALLFVVIYTIKFLSHNLLNALAPSVKSGQTVNFNIEAAKSLNL